MAPKPAYCTLENILQRGFVFCKIKTVILTLWHNATFWMLTAYSPRLVHIIDKFLRMCCISQHVVNVGHWALQTTPRDCLEVATLATHVCSYCLFHELHNCYNVTNAYTNMYFTNSLCNQLCDTNTTFIQSLRYMMTSRQSVILWDVPKYT